MGGMWSVYNDTGNELIGEGEVASLNKSNQQYYLVYNSSTKESEKFGIFMAKNLRLICMIDTINVRRHYMER